EYYCLIWHNNANWVF
nr:immunoglobulin light chain junction region [Macaca mulatta]